MKLTADQIAMLEHVRVADQALRDAHIEEHARARREADERILAFRIERDKHAARAFNAGIPKRRIGIDGLLTSDSKTAAEAIEHGLTFVERELSVEAPAPEAAVEQIERDGDTYTVTLKSSDYDRYDGLVQGDGGEAHAFTVDGKKVLPVGADDDETWTHPVVRVVMAADGVWKKRVLEAAAQELAA